jgi:hypothetical protein
VINSGATAYLSGFSASNVITVDVPQNSETTNNVDSNTGVTTVVTTEKLYFARVQSIDTSNNKSAWTPIVSSTATTFIESAHIIDLTASKITAGTIGAHTITMAGGTSIIKSSTFDGVDVGGGSYANATTGWLINGSGRAYFYDATIAGSIDIGGFDSGSFHVDSEGNLWLGSGTLVNAPFKVLKEGDVTANTITTKNLTLTGNTVMSNNSKIFLGTGVYSNTNTPFYVDDTSKFSLGNKLTWDGSTLTITGNVNITGGNTLTLINDAQSDADTAYSTAISAQGIAISAQNTADDAYSEAITKIGPGTLIAEINGASTTINGDRITTGTLNADRISGGTITATTSLSSLGSITGGTINGTTIECLNVTVADDFSYRARGGFPLSSGAPEQNVGPLWEQIVPGQGVRRIVRFTSLREFKENIEDLSNGLSIINTLRPRIFNWKMGEIDPLTNEPWTDQAKELMSLSKSYGFIVEEVAEDQPELVNFQPPSHEMPWDEEGGLFDIGAWKPGMWDTIEIIPILVKAVQELSAKVEELESRLS